MRLATTVEVAAITMVGDVVEGGIGVGMIGMGRRQGKCQLLESDDEVKLEVK